MNIHVFGAASGIGQWFVEKLFGDDPKVSAYDIAERIQDAFVACPQVNRCFLDRVGSAKGDYLAAWKGQFSPGDWILLAVPEESLAELCALLALHLPEGCCVAVMTSKQERPVALVSEALPGRYVVGMHPLFGHKVGSPYGQIVALCSDAPLPESVEKMQSRLEKSGLTVSHLSPADHDQYMGYVQALTHFVMLAFSGTLSKSGQKIDELMQVKTPPFEFLSAFSSRLLLGAPSTYAAIQNSEVARDIREHFLSFCQTLHDDMSRACDQHRVSKIEEIRTPFTGSELGYCATLSSTAVAAVQAREEQFYRAWKKGELIVFKTDHGRNANMWRVGSLSDVSGGTVKIDEFKLRIKEPDGQNCIVAPVSEDAIDAYKKKGFNIRPRRVEGVKKNHLTLMKNEDAQRWIREQLLPVTANISLENPLGFSSAFLESWLPHTFDDVVRCCVLGEDRGCVALEVTYLPFRSLDINRTLMQAFCNGEAYHAG